MCVVSMVTDHYWRKWPDPVQMPKDIYSDLEELIRKAREYDRIMNQPDCPDPLKQDWYQKLQKLQGGSTIYSTARGSLPDQPIL